MFKQPVLAAAVAIALALSACGSSTASETASKGQPAETKAPTATATAPPAESASGDSSTSSPPVIEGSNAYDVTVSLESNGLPKATRTDIEGGFDFSATNESYSYEIACDKSYSISFMECHSFGADDGFLGFCASFPRDDGMGQDAMDWVNKNVGTEAETVIGDISYTLGMGDAGPYLYVMAPGYNEYLDAALDTAN